MKQRPDDRRRSHDLSGVLEARLGSTHGERAACGRHEVRVIPVSRVRGY
jgi:hypothetical protein